MEQIEESLSSIELFSNLNAGYIDTLGKQCRWRRYGAGQQIIGYQDKSTDVFFIVSGKVRAIIYSISGKEVTFSDFEAGQTFGELAAIDGDPRTANVIAQTDALVEHCQTNLSRLAKGASLKRSGRQLTPLGHCGSAVLLEDCTAIEVAV